MHWVLSLWHAGLGRTRVMAGRGRGAGIEPVEFPRRRGRPVTVPAGVRPAETLGGGVRRQ
ncbi:hypothetical protein GCM10010430_52880 [Kitasatospora cystarginea]|uniref:Uncharacterized protein n=1 Tax=Kitasatospora cystarginea TaxID=58350 RepID=A0ABN3EL22_9ACTN